MATVEFRLKDKLQVINLRQLIRGETHWSMPSGPEGLVVEDLDLVIRWYGPLFDLDEVGRFRLVEAKYGEHTSLETAQHRTFKLMDELFRRGDSEGRYDGFYKLNYSDDEHTPETRYWIGAGRNRNALTSEELRQWILTPYSPFPPLYRREG